MLYLYLDESGDLGFDFVNKKPSVHFTIAVLAVKGHEQNRALGTAIKVTLWRSLKKRRKDAMAELKGSGSESQVKRLFCRVADRTQFKIYAMTINKKLAWPYLAQDKERIYNYIARRVLDNVEFRDDCVRVILTIDKSKTAARIRQFNEYLIAHIKSRLDPLVPLEILHRSSQEVRQLQAVDLAAWGIFRKYERGDTEWLDILRGKIAYEELYRGQKNEERA